MELIIRQKKYFEVDFNIDRFITLIFIDAMIVNKQIDCSEDEMIVIMVFMIIRCIVMICNRVTIDSHQLID